MKWEETDFKYNHTVTTRTLNREGLTQVEVGKDFKFFDQYGTSDHTTVAISYTSILTAKRKKFIL